MISPYNFPQPKYKAGQHIQTAWVLGYESIFRSDTMDSLSLATETEAFIDAALTVAKDYLEPYYWVDTHPEQQEPIVTFVCKAPYAHYAPEARKALIALPLGYPVYFQLWTQGASRTKDKEQLIQKGRPYLDQPQKALGSTK